jgi:hypothetical protein
MISNTMIALTQISPGGLPTPAANQDALHTILSVTFAIIGAIAFLILIISGLRYVISAGDPNAVSKAKNAMVYALVGLAIAISAEAIVAFVVNRL